MKHLLILAAGALACTLGCDRRDSARTPLPVSDTVREATQVKDPVCAMMVSTRGTPEETYRGQTYHFCSKECEAKFRKSPESYMAAGTDATQVKDPVCGMMVSTKGAPAENYKGQTYHFCSNECEDMFQKSPEAYLEAK